MTRTLVRARGLSKIFPMPAGPVTAVQEVSLSIRQGDYAAVRGPSGCGKSTLLHLLGCVETPTAGSLEFDGREVGSLTDRERSRIRLTRIGFGSPLSSYNISSICCRRLRIQPLPCFSSDRY